MNNHNLSRDELIAEGYREYKGKEMNVYYNPETCKHAARCVDGNAAVFNIHQLPWIKVDRAEASEIKRIIDSCPSGALKYVG